MTKVEAKVTTGNTTAPVSSGPSAPVAGGSYQVKPGDTLWDLAKAVYGDGSRWKEIADANPGLTSRGLQPGAQIKLPPKTQSDKLVSGDPGKDATKILDDGKPKSSGPAPQGDPKLSAELQNARAHAAVSGHASEPTEAWIYDKEPQKFLKSGGQQTVLSNDKAVWKGGVKKSFGDDKSNVTDEAGGKKKPEMQYSANVTVASAYGKAEASVWESKEAVGTIAGGNVGYKGQVKVLNAKAEGTASFGADLKQGTIKGDLSGHAEANLVKVEGELKTKPYGNQYIGGQTTVKGKAFVGAEVNGNASVAFDPRKGTVMASAGVDAFAGAKATAELQQSFKVGGMNVGSVGVKGEAYAGIGVKANAKVGIEKGHLKGSIEVGAALGIGAGVKVNFDVNIAEPLQKAGQLAKDIGQGAVNVAKDVGGAIADGASKAWNKVTSFFW